MNDSDNNTNYIPIQPFDRTLSENFLLYDNMTYYRDKNLCGDDSVRRVSGNIVKYYRCDLMPPVEIGGDSSISG